MIAPTVVRRPGDRIAHYTLEARIGTGGMGEVWRAVDERLGRRVAVKLLASVGDGVGPTGDQVARLQREARAAAALSHPNAVSIFDVGDVDGTPYIAMELITGQSLRAFVGDSAIAIDLRVRWLVDVARVLEAAHRAGLVHRDVKPENVMVRDDGVVKVLDFGIARRAAVPVDAGAATESGDLGLPTLTEEGAVVGTTAYMAPEQIRCQPLDGRVDQFAWGVLAWELLAGRRPWTGELLQLVAAILTTPAPSLRSVQPAVTAQLEAVVARALAKLPEERFASMAELIAAVETPSETARAIAAAARASDSGPTESPTLPSVRPELVTAPPATPRGRGPLVALVVAAGALAMALAGGGWFKLKRSSLPTPTAAPAATAPAVRGPLRHLCADPAATARCDGGIGALLAWCDSEQRPIACCAAGLVATGRDGICACPPGGSSSPSGATAACPPKTRVMNGKFINDFFRSHATFRRCYSADAGAQRSVGKVHLGLQLTPDGDVFAARIERASFSDPEVQACILRETRALRFPPPPDGSIDIVMPVALTL